MTASPGRQWHHVANPAEAVLFTTTSDVESCNHAGGPAAGRADGRHASMLRLASQTTFHREHLQPPSHRILGETPHHPPTPTARRCDSTKTTRSPS